MTPIIISYLAVLVCGIAAMIIGFIWFGPLFGKYWMKVCNVSPDDLQKRAEMQKSAGPLYGIQFVLALFQAYVLAVIYAFMEALGAMPAVLIAILIWLAFIMPTIAGICMWNNDSKKVSWIRFLLQSGYYLVLIVVYALILIAWK